MMCLSCAGTNPWPFLRWPGAEQQQWQQLLRGAREAAADGQQAWKARGGRIMGNDYHEVCVPQLLCMHLLASRQGSVLCDQYMNSACRTADPCEWRLHAAQSLRQDGCKRTVAHPL
jgi:hypothetical protein